jgi:hypothetical protein
MTLGAPSPPRSSPARISVPPSFLSTLGVTARTASSYAIRFQPLGEIHILASPSSLPVRPSPSQSHNATCLRTLRRPNRAIHLCVGPHVSFFLVSLDNVSFQQSIGPSGSQSDVVGIRPGISAT